MAAHSSGSMRWLPHSATATRSPLRIVLALLRQRSEQYFFIWPGPADCRTGEPQIAQAATAGLGFLFWHEAEQYIFTGPVLDWLIGEPQVTQALTDGLALSRPLRQRSEHHFRRLPRVG